jgi:enoyl-CoA hydratase/carnithine racemase
MANTVAVNVDAHIANVTLSRPDKMNAINLDMFVELGEMAERIGADSSIRAVVLSGAGEHFCAGIDTSIFGSSGAAIDAEAMAPVAPSPANLFQRAAYVWREIPVPVICAIHGVAFGGGLQIALGADIRFATTTAKFSIMESKWGLIPDMAITATARSVVPVDKIKELAYTARVIDAEEALSVGLVTQLHDVPLDAAMATAAAIADRSPDAIRAMKALFDSAWHAPVDEALAKEARFQGSVLGRENQREAVLANVEKRAPKFVP